MVCVAYDDECAANIVVYTMNSICHSINIVAASMLCSGNTDNNLSFYIWVVQLSKHTQSWHTQARLISWIQYIVYFLYRDRERESGLSRYSRVFALRMDRYM